MLANLAKMTKMANLAKVVILAKFGQCCGGNVVGEYIN